MFREFSLFYKVLGNTRKLSSFHFHLHHVLEFVILKLEELGAPLNQLDLSLSIVEFSELFKPQQFPIKKLSLLIFLDVFEFFYIELLG